MAKLLCHIVAMGYSNVNRQIYIADKEKELYPLQQRKQVLLVFSKQFFIMFRCSVEFYYMLQKSTEVNLFVLKCTQHYEL